jgi:hypothetical protein
VTPSRSAINRGSRLPGSCNRFRIRRHAAGKSGLRSRAPVYNKPWRARAAAGGAGREEKGRRFPVRRKFYFSPSAPLLERVAAVLLASSSRARSCYRQFTRNSRASGQTTMRRSMRALYTHAYRYKYRYAWLEGSITKYVPPLFHASNRASILVYARVRARAPPFQFQRY